MNFIFTSIGCITLLVGKILMIVAAPTALVVAALKAYTAYILQAGTVSVVLTFIGWWCVVGMVIALIGFFAMFIGYFTIPEEFRETVKSN